MALPAPAGKRNWRDVFGMPNDGSVTEVHNRYHRLASPAYPDKDGSHEAMVELNAGWQRLQQHLKTQNDHHHLQSLLLQALPRHRQRRYESREICSLAMKFEVDDLNADRMPTKRRKFGFAIIQRMEQQASLELVSNFGIGKTVDKTMDSHLFRSKSNRRHDGPPARQPELKSLTALAVNSSALRRLGQHGV